MKKKLNFAIIYNVVDKVPLTHIVRHRTTRFDTKYRIRTYHTNVFAYYYTT